MRVRHRTLVLTGALIAVALPAVGDDSLVKGLELARRGRCSEAIPIFEALVRKQPKDITFKKLLARCLSSEKRPAEARAQYNQILAIAPNDLDATTKLRPPVSLVAPDAPAPVQQVSRKLDREAVERQRAGSQLVAAEQAIQSGRLAEAERILTGLTQRDVALLIPQLRLAELYSRTKRPELAARAYESMAERFARTEYLHRAAQSYSWAKQYADSVRLFKLYLEKTPGDHAATLSMANVLLWSDKLQEAIETYRFYLAAVPQDHSARISLANALLWSEQFSDALAELKLLAQARPDDRSIQLALARSYAGVSQPQMAMGIYDRMLLKSPSDQEVMTIRESFMRDVPLQAAATLTARKDYENAARFLEAHLKRTPDDADAILQLARVYWWAEQYGKAASWYENYNSKKADATGVRELGRVYLAMPDYPAARRIFTNLVKSKSATVEDHEALVNAWIWSADVKSAAPYVSALLELDANNDTGLRALKAIRDSERGEALDSARRIIAEKRYKDALLAYQTFSEKYGADRDVELTLARLYSWDKQYAKAAVAYSEYLSRYKNDEAARLELANLQNWSRKWDAAEREYKGLLRRDPRNAQAAFGIASLSDYRGEDRFRVYDAYKRALAMDPSNVAARRRLQELGPLVSPYAGWQQRGFTDSDGFGRSVNTLEASFPLTGGVRFTPFARYGYFTQARQIGGADCGVVGAETQPGIRSLNRQICASDGTLRGSGGGIRFDLRPASSVSFNGEISALRFNAGRGNSLNYSGQLQFGGLERSFSVTLMRRDAVYDVNTAASLFAGIMADTAMLSYQQALSGTTRLWTAVAATRYSQSGDFRANTQRRLAAVIDREMLPGFRTGFFVRATDFAAPSRLYFSPSFYGVAGFQYAYRKELTTNVRFALDGDIGSGRIHRFDLASVNVLEVSLFPSLEWRVRPDLLLQFGYRFARGQSSAFGSPAYRSSGFDFGLQNSFMPLEPRTRLSGIDIR